MRSKLLLAALLVGIGVIVSAGLVAAQQGRGRGPAGGQGRGPVAGPRLARPGLTLPRLLTSPTANVEVVNTDNGVDVRLTAEEKLYFPRMQQIARAWVEQVNRYRSAEERPAAPPPAGSGAVLGLIASGKVKLTAENLDNGVVLRFTTEDAELVKEIQQRVGTWVTQTRSAAQIQQALAVLANDKVKLEVKKTDKGITVLVTSDDPELIEQIQTKLAPYFQGQKEYAKRATGFAGRWGAAGTGWARWRGERRPQGRRVPPTPGR